MVEPSICQDSYLRAILPPVLGKILLRGVFEWTLIVCTPAIKMAHFLPLTILPPMRLAWFLHRMFFGPFLDADTLVEIPTVALGQP